MPGLQWHFWVVSNEYDEYANAEIEGGPDRRRRLIMRTDRVAVGIKTWAEIIEENRARLQFFQEHLKHTADQSVSLKYLKEKHSEFLTGVVVEEDGPDEPDNGKPAAKPTKGKKPAKAK